MEPESIQPDTFQGADDLQTLSNRVAMRRPVSDKEFAAALGTGCMEAFRCARDALAGRSRLTGEPSLCHGLDMALRAEDLHLGEHAARLCLIHDLVEDTCIDLPAAHTMLRVIADRLGEAVAHDLLLLTNRYDLIARGIAPALPASLPFTPMALPPVSRALAAFRESLPAAVRAAAAHEFSNLQRWIQAGPDLSTGTRLAEVSPGHTVLQEIRLQGCYRLYVQDLCNDGVTRNPPRIYETDLLVKCLDVVDNLRTSSVTNRLALEKTVAKASVFLDTSFHLAQSALPERRFRLMYDYVKCTLVEVLTERRYVLSLLGEGRLRARSEVLREWTEQLRCKYQVGPTPVQRLRQLRGEIRQLGEEAAPPNTA